MTMTKTKTKTKTKTHKTFFPIAHTQYKGNMEHSGQAAVTVPVESERPPRIVRSFGHLGRILSAPVIDEFNNLYGE